MRQRRTTARPDRVKRRWSTVFRGRWAIGALTVGTCLVMSGTAAAVPPPPPNPSDSELQQSREHAHQKAGAVGDLASDLADAEAELNDLKATVGRKLELAKKAMVDLNRARKAADEAEQKAADAKDAVQAATKRVERAREKLDKFIAGSYQQGSKLGSASAYLGSDDISDVLERAQLLDSIADSRLNALDTMHRAQTAKANKESAARKALREARERREEAEQAKREAEQAKQEAIEAKKKQAGRIEELQQKKERLQRQLYEARQKVDSLEGQRDAYQDWLERKRAEERRQRQQALAANSGSSTQQASQSTGSANNQTSGGQSASALIEQVIARAKSQLGVTYAWGGGNAYGPTSGIHDGGVADAHGDWKKVGFDCSGLMSYAFAPVEIIPSYSGYQYDAGRKVPVSQAQRGDMLFWGPGGSTHVALYLGDGMMIEAPFSGGHVRIAPVRYAGIAPYAVRMVG